MMRLDPHLVTKNGLASVKFNRTLFFQISKANLNALFKSKSSNLSYYISPTNLHRLQTPNKFASKHLQNGCILTLNKSSFTLLPKICQSTYSATFSLDHSYHTSTKSYQKSEIEAKHPKVKIESGNVCVSWKDKAVQIPLLWLRDHCRCPRCYNHETFQKNVDVDLMQRDLNPANIQITEKEDLLVVEWKDDHTSTFSMEELQSWYYPGSYRQHGKPFLWNAASITAEGIPAVGYEDHMNTESGLKQTISNLVNFGFSFVDEAPVSIEATQVIAERVGIVMPTKYGGMWTLTSISEDFKDTAYSSVRLGAHTDLTYHSSGAGIQIFHCKENRGRGGETLLVDGFHAASILRQRYPESFECLTSCIVPHESKEPKSGTSAGCNLYNLCQVLTVHPNSGELIQIRFNPYDRAPLNTIPSDQVQDFYIAYDRLTRIIEDPANEFWIPLTPGRVLFIDNWRVMHGRAEFTGLRTLFGCYLQRDEWISKARVFDLF